MNSSIRHNQVAPLEGVSPCSAREQTEDVSKSARNESQSDVAFSLEKHEPFLQTNASFVPTSWDLVMIIDVMTEDNLLAEKEIRRLSRYLRVAGVHLSKFVILDDDLKWTGRVLALCTATQDEFEQEAEIWGLSKPLRLSRSVAKTFRLHPNFGHITAPFSVARKWMFHDVPSFSAIHPSRVRTRGDGDDQDRSGLLYFSTTERQDLLERMIESQVLKTSQCNQGFQELYLIIWIGSGGGIAQGSVGNS